MLSCWEKQMLHLGSKVQNKVIYKTIKLELWFYEIHTKLSEIPIQVLLKTKMGNFFAYQMPTYIGIMIKQHFQGKSKQITTKQK